MPIRIIWINRRRMPISIIREIRSLTKKSGWNVLLCSTFQPLFIVWEQCLGYGYTLHHFVSVMLAPITESRWAYCGHCIIWGADMAIAFKPTCGLNVFALQYVNSQCQHDSLILKLAAKLHLFTETTQFLSDYFNSSYSYILRIYFFQTDDPVIFCAAKIKL